MTIRGSSWIHALRTSIDSDVIIVTLRAVSVTVCLDTLASVFLPISVYLHVSVCIYVYICLTLTLFLHLFLPLLRCLHPLLLSPIVFQSFSFDIEFSLQRFQLIYWHRSLSVVRLYLSLCLSALLPVCVITYLCLSLVSFRPICLCCLRFCHIPSSSIAFSTRVIYRFLFCIYLCPVACLCICLHWLLPVRVCSSACRCAWNRPSCVSVSCVLLYIFLGVCNLRL